MLPTLPHAFHVQVTVAVMAPTRSFVTEVLGIASVSQTLNLASSSHIITYDNLNLSMLPPAKARR